MARLHDHTRFFFGFFFKRRYFGVLLYGFWFLVFGIFGGGVAGYYFCGG